MAELSFPAVDVPDFDIAAAAEREGLLDVAYGEVDAPFGRLVCAVTPRGLVRVSFDPAEETAEDLARRLSPRVLRAPAKVDAARRQLDDWFAGRRRDFDLRLDPALMRSDFQRAVLDVTRTIPYGTTKTYGEVAAGAGSPGAVRAAGSALGANPLCVVVPCHRVLRAGGGLGGYAGGLAAKEWLLASERR